MREREHHPYEEAFNPAKLSKRKREKLRAFREKLEGWMTSPDGEDYCPSCWERYLESFDESTQHMVEQDSQPTSKKDIVITRQAKEGY